MHSRNKVCSPTSDSDKNLIMALHSSQTVRSSRLSASITGDLALTRPIAE